MLRQSAFFFSCARYLAGPSVLGRFPDNTIAANRPWVHRYLVRTLTTKIMQICPAIDQLVAVLEQYMTDLEDYQTGFDML